MLKSLNNKYFAVFALGAISAAAFAPLYLFFLALISFSGLLIISDLGKTKKEAFWLGWCFGFGQFVCGFYWISISLFVDIAKFFWLLPFALFLIPAVLAIYVGLVLLLFSEISKRLNSSAWQKILLFSVIWLGGEYLRSTLFTGFPWNLTGYSLEFSAALAQSGSLVGVYGLSLIAIIFYSLPILFLNLQSSKIKFYFNKNNLSFLALVLIALSAMWVWGNNRLKTATIKPLNNATFRLVQPNIKEEDKWDPEHRYNSFIENVNLSRLPGFDRVNYVVWSESAVPYVISVTNDHELLTKIAQAVPHDGFVITGALRAQFKNIRELDKIWNSVFAIDNAGQIAATYDKNHLVPFGEYVPLEKFLPFISKITDGAVGFSEGDGLKTIKLNDKSFSPLVCYEAIFPNQVIDKKSPPQFLLNLTNDAWFGTSSGPYQHFDMVRMRAIEYGLPLIRVANSGISALVDPWGRVVKAIPLNQKGMIDVNLMDKLPATFYAQYGQYLLSALIVLMLIMALI